MRRDAGKRATLAEKRVAAGPPRPSARASARAARGAQPGPRRSRYGALETSRTRRRHLGGSRGDDGRSDA